MPSPGHKLRRPVRGKPKDRDKPKLKGKGKGKGKGKNKAKQACLFLVKVRLRDLLGSSSCKQLQPLEEPVQGAPVLLEQQANKLLEGTSSWEHSR